MTDNIFTKMHTDREGNETPIISMGTDHLVRMVNFVFRRGLQQRLQQLRSHLVGGYAPEGMPEKQRRSLGLRKLTPERVQQVQSEMDEYESDALEAAMHEYWPYVVVGVMRDDTREGVVKILQDAFGINGRIELPGLMTVTGQAFELPDGEDLSDIEAALEEGAKERGDDWPW